MKTEKRVVRYAVLLAVGASSALCAQTIEYTVTEIPFVPGTFSAQPRAVNNNSEVVGAAFGSGLPNFFLLAWRWTAQDGVTLLPAPPPPLAALRYGARDISDTGLISGDEGEGGASWRFDNGVYTIIGPLPSSQFGSTGRAVNDNGDVVGSSGGVTITDPAKATLFTDGMGLVDLTPGSTGEARDINNAGQIAGWANPDPIVFSIEAFRFTPGVGMEFLGSPPGLNTSRAYAINEAGDVVGEAFVNNNISQAFLFTDGGGIQALPPAGNPRNQATGINILRQVVGNGFEGPIHGWVWSAENGTRNLDDLVDPALQFNITQAFDINDKGEIIAMGLTALDPVSPVRMLLLTPFDPNAPPPPPPPVGPPIPTASEWAVAVTALVLLAGGSFAIKGVGILRRGQRPG